ncbi:MAG: ABC transporter substrate-binding protein [Actinophytocola sp.]|nr:ABC transporter substrate-binding protein [Actinophytocola sp.]
MTNRQNHRVVAALLAVVSLTIAACGTRLDHNQIVGAASVSGVAGSTEAGAGMPGDSAIAGELTPGVTGESLPGAEGTAGAGSDPAAAARQPGTAGGQGSARTPSGGGSGGGPIVIGSVGSYSGATGTAWASGARALQAWAASINEQGGINGRQVKVIVYDDGSDPAKARSQVQELVEQHNAVAIVAAITTAQTLKAWRGYVEQKRVPVIGGDCGPAWTASPVLFRQCTTSKDNLVGFAELAAKFGKSKDFGALFCQEDEGCSFAEQVLFNDGAAERAGLNPRYRARISITQPDFTSECIQARNNGVELLFVAADPNTVGRVADSCRRQNYHPQFAQIDGTVNAATASKPGLEDVLMVSRVFPFTGISSPAFHEFESAWEKYGSGQPAGPATAMGWAAATIFEQVAKDVGGDIGREQLLRQLYRIKNQTFGGLTVPLSFGSNGTTAAKCLFIMQGERGRWTAPQGDKPQCF